MKVVAETYPEAPALLLGKISLSPQSMGQGERQNSEHSAFRASDRSDDVRSVDRRRRLSTAYPDSVPHAQAYYSHADRTPHVRMLQYLFVLNESS